MTAAGGISEHSSTVYTEGRQSIVLKTADSAPKVVSVKRSESEPEPGQQQADGRWDVDNHSTSNIVKVQAPDVQTASPSSASSHTKFDLPVHSSKQGTNGEVCSLLFVQDIRNFCNIYFQYRKQFLNLLWILTQVAQLWQRDCAFLINVQCYSQNHAHNHIFATPYGGFMGNINTLSENVNAKKLCCRVSSRECQFYS